MFEDQQGDDAWALSDAQDHEFIPLISQEDEEAMQKEEVPEALPILSLRNTVLFPGVVIPITVGRDRSIRLIKEAHKEEHRIGVVSQKNDDIEVPHGEDLNEVGTVAKVIKMLRMPDGSNTVILQGQKRFKWTEIVQEEPYMKARVVEYDAELLPQKDDEHKALMESLKELAIEIIQLSPNIPSEAGFAIKSIESLTFLVNFIGSNMNAPVEEKQALLEVAGIKARARRVLELLNKEKQMLSLKRDIQTKVKGELDQQQREYFLNQQLKQIQEELGNNPQAQEVAERKLRAEGMDWPEHAREAFNKEIIKLERMNSQSAEYSVQANYVDLMLDLPWKKRSADNFDLFHAQAVLDEDHYGLEKVKERIIEHLAVLKIKGDLKAPIICLYGPPGVGKTSLGRSIAKALGREYVRMSLGGLRDEAEIRGHRKTYIGAMPGRILQNLKKAGTSNPLFVLDEIDKLGRDHHGDPSSAMLEVLDPEQNSTFHDNYLDLDYDLSNVMFLATCNNLSSIQPALRDRMEIIEVTGYTVEEKVQIAKRHLVPKHLEDTGISTKDLKLPVKTLEAVVEQYTSESGVRGLEKRIGKLVRNRAKEMALEEDYQTEISPEDLPKVLGPSRERDRYQGNDTAGVVTGLAWTPHGGDILFIETSLTKGTGKLTLTGNLGDVMKESAIIALEYIKSHAGEMGLDADELNQLNVHLHVPQGAIPKDGPSAGITMVSAMVSAFTRRKIRKALAMTGEITLRGQVLPVGGIKEKILAAKRAGIKEIILCDRNRQDIEEIDERYLKGLTFTYVSDIMEVVHRALLQEKVSSLR
ncbi:MAG: endopeptidase La [Flavobacteriales bacterium]